MTQYGTKWTTFACCAQASHDVMLSNFVIRKTEHGGKFKPPHGRDIVKCCLHSAVATRVRTVTFQNSFSKGKGNVNIWFWYVHNEFVFKHIKCSCEWEINTSLEPDIIFNNNKDACVFDILPLQMGLYILLMGMFCFTFIWRLPLTNCCLKHG